MTKYPINLAPGATTTVESRGGFLYFESASAGGADTSIKIVIPGANGGELILQVGQGFKQKFDRFFVTNAVGAGTIVGFLVIADDEFIDHRVVGTVNVIDGGKSRTAANSAFAGYLYQPLVAGNIAQVQLWNPVGNNKNLFVEQIIVFVTSPAANGIGVRKTNAALGASLGNAISKKLGGAASSAELHAASTVTAAATAADTLIALSKSVAFFKFTEPLMIVPGMGLMLLNASAGEEIGATFEFFEEPQ